MKIKNILLASLIFIFLEAVAFLMFYFIWITAPQESIMRLEDNYNGFFKYAIIWCFTLSVSTCNYLNSIKLANIILNPELLEI